jgi:DNA-binding MarR family transcriptional regulator
VEIFGRILRASRYTDSARQHVFKRFGLDFGLFEVLAALRRQGPPYRLPPSELNRWCLLTSGAMTKRLDRLQKAGLIVRKADSGDRRSVLVELSPAGRALVDQVIVAHLENESRLLGPLSPKMRAELAALLRRLLSHLEREVGESNAATIASRSAEESPAASPWEDESTPLRRRPSLSPGTRLNIWA